MLLAIDPGASPGFAQFTNEGVLEFCSNDLDFFDCMMNDNIVCEQPMIYPYSKANPNAIIQLAITAGRLVERASGCETVPVRWYLPREWKGQIPKTTVLAKYIIYKRIRGILSKAELAVFDKAIATVGKKAGFDVTDAVGIGLHHLQRL